MEYLYNEILVQLKQNQFLSGGVLLGLLGSIFYSMKTIPLSIWSKIRYQFNYTAYFDEKSDIYFTFSRWFHDKYPQKFRNIDMDFVRRSPNTPITEDVKGKWTLKRKQFTDTNFIWYKRRLLKVSKSRKDLETIGEHRAPYFHSYNISGLFAKNAINDLAREVLAYKDSQIGVYVSNWGNFTRGNFNNPKDFKNIFFENKQELIEDLQMFTKKRAFYKEKDINYKRSYLFYGRGGTGKTSISTAIAKYLDYDIYILNLNAIQSDREFIELAARIPCESLVLFEDIDCYFNQREMKNDKISFSTVLNVFDGAYSPSDCIFVMTTNKLDQLDDALIRKGRVDKMFHVDYPRVQDVEDFMSNFYEQSVKLNIKSFDKPMVDVQEICLNATLEDAIKQIENCTKKVKVMTGAGI